MTGETAFCDSCRRSFVRQGGWQRLCYPCFLSIKKKNDAEKARAEGYAAGYHAGVSVQMSKPAAPSLDRDTLREIVALTHPDRHPPERNAVANRITAILLAMMKKGTP
jgi:hypothetical protein